MGRYTIMVWILAAVVGLGLLAWRMSAFAEATKSLPDDVPVLVGQGTASPIGLADQTSALAQVRRATSMAELYRAETGSYAGLTAETLRSLDPSVAPTSVVVTATPSGYCIQATSGSMTVHATGPSALADGPCP